MNRRFTAITQMTLLVSALSFFKRSYIVTVVLSSNTEYWPRQTNRIFLAGPGIVYVFFSAIVPSPLLLTPSANRIFSAGRCIVYPFFSAVSPSPFFFFFFFFLPFSANKSFRRLAPLLFHRPNCLPLSTNRIFSPGPCNVCAFFSAIVPSPLLFTALGQKYLFGGTVFWQCVFLGYCSVAYFVLLKCSENRFNVTKISKRAIESYWTYRIFLHSAPTIEIYLYLDAPSYQRCITH